MRTPKIVPLIPGYFHFCLRILDLQAHSTSSSLRWTLRNSTDKEFTDKAGQGIGYSHSKEKGLDFGDFSFFAKVVAFLVMEWRRGEGCWAMEKAAEWCFEWTQNNMLKKCLKKQGCMREACSLA